MIRPVTLLAVVDMVCDWVDPTSGSTSSTGEATVEVETLTFCLPKESFHIEDFLTGTGTVDDVGTEDVETGVFLLPVHRCFGIPNIRTGS